MEENLSYLDRLSPILEAMPDALVIVDDRGRIVLINQQTETLFNYKRNEVLGELVEILMPNRFRKHHPSHRDHYFSNPRVRSMGSGLELYGLKSDGSEFPIEISLSPLQTEDGRFALAAIRDITIRKKAEAKFKAIIEATPDCLVMINKSGEIILANALSEKLFGYTKEQLIGQKVEFLIPNRFHPNHEAHRTSYFMQPRTRPMGVGLDLFGLHKDGHEFPVEISLSPLETEDGLLALAAIRDITDRKSLVEQLRAKNIELEKVSLAKDHFLASMSHELRTPLNAIIGFTGTLLMKLPGPLNANQEKQLTTVKNSAKHLLSLINDLLDLTKIESGKVELQLEKVSCDEIINDVITSLTPIAESKKIDLQAKIPSVKIYAETDRRALTQILINLTNNALKFTEQGRVEINIDIRIIDNTEYAAINVTDSGIGIKQEDVEKLFKAFEQVKIPGKVIEGTGLGLHLSQKLATLINGKIEFSSKYGEGSTFSILIPKM